MGCSSKSDSSFCCYFSPCRDYLKHSNVICTHTLIQMQTNLIV